MQTRADAEIIVYSINGQKPGDQVYAVLNDRQENSQGSPEFKNHQNQNKQGQGRNRSHYAKGCRILFLNKLAYKQ